MVLYALAMRYAGGDLDALDQTWTVTAVDVVNEALDLGDGVVDRRVVERPPQ